MASTRRTVRARPTTLRRELAEYIDAYGIKVAA
jgi:hypothetical protein